MSLYDEARTIPYDTFDYKAECDRYDCASSDWEKYAQACALAKFAHNNGDRGGEETWLLKALYWTDEGSAYYSEVCNALASFCDSYGVYVSYHGSRLEARHWRRLARGEDISDNPSGDSNDGSGPSAAAAAQVGAAASKGFADQIGCGTIVVLPIVVFVLGKFILDTYGDAIMAFLKVVAAVLVAIVAIVVIKKFVLPRLHR